MVEIRRRPEIPSFSRLDLGTTFKKHKLCSITFMWKHYVESTVDQSDIFSVDQNVTERELDRKIILM